MRWLLLAIRGPDGAPSSLRQLKVLRALFIVSMVCLFGGLALALIGDTMDWRILASIGAYTAIAGAALFILAGIYVQARAWLYFIERHLWED